MRVNPDHADFPALLAEVLDLLAFAKDDLAAVACIASPRRSAAMTRERAQTAPECCKDGQGAANPCASRVKIAYRCNIELTE